MGFVRSNAIKRIVHIWTIFILIRENKSSALEAAEK